MANNVRQRFQLVPRKLNIIIHLNIQITTPLDKANMFKFLENLFPLKWNTVYFAYFE